MESAVGLDDAHGKEMARRPGQSRDIVCNLSLIDRLEPLVCLAQQRVHALCGR
jgi:hypothetical protein